MLVTISFATQAMAELPDYPSARRLSIVENINGTEVQDPYRWMEEADSAELKDWVEAQTAIADEFVAGADYEAIVRRIEQLGRFDLGFAGKRRNDRLFYLLRPKDGGPVRLYVDDGKNPQLLVHSEQIPEPDFKESYLGGRGFARYQWPDRAGNLVAYGYTDGATPAVRFRVIDAQSGKHLPDVIEDVVPAFAVVEWNATGDGFYYFRARSADVEGTSGSRTEPIGLYFHRLGTHQDEDRAVISQQADDRNVYWPAVSSDGRYLVVQKREGSAAVSSYLIYDNRDPDAEPSEWFANANARFIYLGNDGTHFFFQTTMGAPNGRIVSVDLNSPGEVEEWIPESELDMLAGSNVGGDVIGYFGGYFVIGYLRDGVPEVRIFDRKGSFERTLPLTDGFSIWGGLHGTPNGTQVTAGLLNALSPSSIITINLVDGSVREDFSADVPFDSADFVVQRVTYESRDGTRVPMSVVHHKDVQLDGNNPALIYGYGMHKWVSFLFYQAHIIHWMELGGVYAMPAIRGGGEYGDEWHESGITTNRQNAMDDYVWAGKWLIEEGYSSPSMLVANGGSASGPLAGMVPLQYGDVFAAATIDYPVLDLVRGPLYGNGALMIEEYGSLDIAEESRAMIKQSPYHHALDASSCFPPTLVLVGENDQTVLPFHGYKYTAAMQRAQQCDNPVLLKMMRDTGHNYGLTPEAFAANAGAQIAFLKKVLGF